MAENFDSFRIIVRVRYVLTGQREQNVFVGPASDRFLGGFFLNVGVRKG